MIHRTSHRTPQKLAHPQRHLPPPVLDIPNHSQRHRRNYLWDSV